LSDIIDDNSQTVTSGITTDHSRTPSPQKAISTTTVPPIPITTNAESPIHKPKTPPIQQTPISSLPMGVPKPFRSNNHESVGHIYFFFSYLFNPSINSGVNIFTKRITHSNGNHLFSLT
jgi:hypothetical protein